MWLLTIILFSHSCTQSSGDEVWSSICGERQGAVEFTSEKACDGALDGLSLAGKPRFAEHGVRLTYQALAFCEKQDATSGTLFRANPNELTQWLTPTNDAVLHDYTLVPR